ncbi:Choline transport protein [Elsinoe australis]|uniref:Choline transport protein n=1 Tax=Elsinoe australis TaxID=40998 RepID=A0A2P7YNB9_9PEZI|nr:Choline transport protein [Elsinoe australis]
MFSIRQYGFEGKQASRVEGGEYGYQDPKGATDYDLKDMDRIGKKQELRRRFKATHIVGFGSLLGAAWPYMLTTGGFSLANGGPGGSVIAFIVVAFILVMSNFSLAEAASIAPTSGGQYHWVSEFAPPSVQRYLSYVVGWLCTLGWQVGLASVCYASALQIQALIAVWDENYALPGWQAALIAIAFNAAAIFFNTVLVKHLPVFEASMLIVFALGFIAYVVVFWTLSPLNDATFVFTSIQDNNGWGNTGLAVLVGILTPISSLTSADSSCHLAEELKDASRVLPRAMIATQAVNFAAAFVMLISFLFALTNVEDALNSPTGVPYIAVLLNTTGSKSATTGLVFILILMLFCCAVNLVTTSSRQCFAFARDNGLPFSQYLAHVQPGMDIPLNAVLLTFGFTLLISLILFGSAIAFNIICSLGAAAILTSYVIVHACMLYRDFVSPVPAARFSLGKWRYVVRPLALAGTFLVDVLVFFPPAPNPTPETMNWVCLIFGAVVAGSTAWYWAWGRKVYEGPVREVKSEVVLEDLGRAGSY